MSIKEILCPITPVLTLQGWDWRGHSFIYIIGEATIVCTRCGYKKFAHHLMNTEPRAKELLGDGKRKVPHQ